MNYPGKKVRPKEEKEKLNEPNRRHFLHLNWRHKFEKWEGY